MEYLSGQPKRVEVVEVVVVRAPLMSHVSQTSNIRIQLFGLIWPQMLSELKLSKII